MTPKLIGDGRTEQVKLLFHTDGPQWKEESRGIHGCSQVRQEAEEQHQPFPDGEIEKLLAAHHPGIDHPQKGKPKGHHHEVQWPDTKDPACIKILDGYRTVTVKLSQYLFGVVF